MRRRIILRRCQFDAPLSYRIFRSALRAGSPGATSSETLFSSSVINPTCVAGLISENSFGRYIEPADHAANAYLMGLYVDRRLVSSLRLQIGCATTPNFSSLELFPHVLEPLLRSNKTVVDMSCVATDGEIARSYVWLPYLILRSWIMAAEHFHADYIAAAMRPQHQLFYKRTLDCELHSELRLPPHQLATVGLVTLNFATSAKRLYENLPFLRSTPSERQQLFEHDRTPSRVTGQYPSVS